MGQDVVIEVKGLVKTFGKKTVLNGLNMTIRRGDIYGFIGNNGSGKTTAMKIILGLLEADSGDITLFGSKDLLAERKRIGSLIEAPGLYKGCTAKENMKRFAMLFGGEEKEIDDLLAFVGLGDVGKKKVRAFSLGMKQRLGIAVALLGNPEILVLDEPTNGLDPAGIKDLRELFEKIASEKGVSLLISSHHLDELSRIANVYGILVDGRIVDETRKDDILA
ncbi:MAG: ATP-binding cassette domain-containing protein, partial [Bacillales bacterium]|nr:ATP-binding cassette domain-containing protein [Bacillales bacterium]MDY5919483.1 ATP-binding cassette domain-containing protein [Candidatus Enteromonas sp.]